MNQTKPQLKKKEKKYKRLLNPIQVVVVNYSKEVIEFRNMASFIPKNLIALVGSFGGLYGICQVKSNRVKAEENFVKTSKLENNYKPNSLFQIEEINSANDKSARKLQEEKLQKIITESKNLCWLKITNSAIPGLAIAVSVDGKTVFRHGFGYADVENKVLATASHVFRIGKYFLH